MGLKMTKSTHILSSVITSPGLDFLHKVREHLLEPPIAEYRGTSLYASFNHYSTSKDIVRDQNSSAYSFHPTRVYQLGIQ